MMILKTPRLRLWLLALTGLLMATTLAPTTAKATAAPPPSLPRQHVAASSSLPIYATVVGATFSEPSLSSDASTVTETGTLTFTVSDESGLNPGWVAHASSTDFVSSLTLVTIPASDLAVSSLPVVRTACTGACSAGQPIPSSVGTTFDTNPAVAVACPAQVTGTGTYTVSVPFVLTVSGLAAQWLERQSVSSSIVSVSA